MKTLTVGVIAVLLVVAVLDMAEGTLEHAKRALAKLEHAKHSHAKLDHAKYAHAKHEHAKSAAYQRDDGDNGTDITQCIKEKVNATVDLSDITQAGAEPDPHILKCAAGCFYEAENFTTNGELNKDVFAKYLVSIGIEEAEAMKDAEECETSLADIPEGDTCERGGAVDVCIRKSIPVYEEQG